MLDKICLILVSVMLLVMLAVPAMAADVTKRAAMLKESILANLYDAQRGLFFEGLNTPSPEHLLYVFRCSNVGCIYIYNCYFFLE